MATDTSLESKTHVYWIINSAHCQRPEGIDIAVGDAISTLSAICNTTNPARALVLRVNELQGNLINGVNIIEREAQSK